MHREHRLGEDVAESHSKRRDKREALVCGDGDSVGWWEGGGFCRENNPMVSPTGSAHLLG